MTDKGRHSLIATVPVHPTACPRSCVQPPILQPESVPKDRSMILFFCLLVCPSAPVNVEPFYRLSVRPSDRVSCMFIRLFARLRGCPPTMLFYASLSIQPSCGPENFRFCFSDPVISSS